MSDFHASLVAHGNGDSCGSMLTSKITVSSGTDEAWLPMMDFLLFMELLTQHKVFHAAGVLVLTIPYNVLQCL